jgi:putative transposase
MIRAYLYALDPTPEQEEAFRSHCGGSRFAYNWALARVKANWDQRVAEKSYGLADDALTPWIDTRYVSLNNEFNAIKDSLVPWNRENSSRIYNCAFINFATAMKNRRSGRTRMPKFKSKRGRQSFQMAGVVRLSNDRRHIVLPRIGTIRTHESTRKLARHVEAGNAKIKTCTVSKQRGRWHISVLAELPDTEPVTRQQGRVVGVDLGIKSLAVLSTGETVPNPRHLEADLARLRHAQRAVSRRRGPDRRTRQEPSNRWRKARATADRIHTRIAARRRDHLHKLSTRLVNEFDTIVVEDLAVKNMLRNRKLARHIAGASWAELRRQLTYKAEWTGARLIVADRFSPSSKTCSGCGAVKAKLALSERTYVCMSCGLVLDRDENAARNLAALAVDTRELRGELPDGSGVRPAVLAQEAVALPREESLTQPHRREAMSVP